LAEDIDQKRFKQDTNSIIADTLTNLAEGVTGIAASKKQEWVLSIGHIVQGVRGGQFLSILQREWDSYKEKGRIKEDYQFTDQNYTCLHEILDFLEKDIPDETRFNLLKQLFLVTSTETMSNRDSILPQQYMKICKTLTTGEILVLNATYGVAKEDWWKDQHFGAHDWLGVITEKSGLAQRELVEIHERTLINKKLLSPRTLSDESGVRISPFFRLTDLGHKICEFVASYEPIRDQQE